MRIVTRSEWGAAVPKSRTRIPTPVPRLWLHHTGSTADSGARTVLAIQRFHMGTRGWNDIAYSWLYSPSTRLFYEGRGAGVQGAHTSGDNTRSHALCVLGNFDTQRPPSHVVADLRAFLRWHASYGPSRFTGGHRDAPGASTACPGRHLYALLPTLNSVAAPPKDDDMEALTKLVQQAVKDAGQDPGAIDGIPGPRTQAALTAALRSSGARGPKGDTGPRGPAGAKGDTGPRGARGPAGQTPDLSNLVIPIQVRQ